MSRPTLTLTELADAPELSVTIGGQLFHFSELPLERLARLQSYINRTVPDPWQHARERAAGLPDAVAAALLENARQESLRWPPQLGTAAGAVALLSTDAGQLEALHEALQVHQPGITRDDARAVFRLMRKDSAARMREARRAGRAYQGEGVARRIFAVAFGQDDPDLDDGQVDRDGVPKA